MKADAQTEAEVMVVIRELSVAYIRRDLNALIALYSAAAVPVAYGTGIDEKAVGIAEIKALYERDINQADSVNVVTGWHSVSVNGPVAWVAEEATVEAEVEGNKLSFPLRKTVVLEKQGGKWLVVQCHFSLPAANQPEGKAYPAPA